MPRFNFISLFADFFGHGGKLAVEEGALLWFTTIYSINLDRYNYSPPVQADLKRLTEEIVVGQSE